MFLYSVCSYNRYVLITGVLITGIFLETGMFLYSVCSYNRYVLTFGVLITGIFLEIGVLITGMFL